LTETGICADSASRTSSRSSGTIGPVSGQSSVEGNLYALAATLDLAERIREGVIVTIFPDSGTRYLSESFWDPTSLKQEGANGRSRD